LVGKSKKLNLRSKYYSYLNVIIKHGCSVFEGYVVLDDFFTNFDCYFYGL